MNVLSHLLAVAIFTPIFQSIWSLCEFVINGVNYDKSTHKCNISYNDLETALKRRTQNNNNKYNNKYIVYIDNP